MLVQKNNSHKTKINFCLMTIVVHIKLIYHLIGSACT